MRLLKCSVRLNSTTKVFYPGDTVGGDIVIINNKRRYVRGLQLKVKGECTVSYTEREWTKGIDGKYRSKPVNHSAVEVYLYKLLNIFGNDGANAEILPGRYEYPFSFTLPCGIPSSFKGKHGHVVYEIIAVLPRSWAFDCKTSTIFHVLGTLNLKLIPLAHQQSILRKQKQSKAFCCVNRELSFVLVLQRCGVVIGEIIPILLDINNKTKFLARGKFSIVQEATFYAQDNQRSDRNVICVVEVPTVDPGEAVVWRNSKIQIPLLPPSQLGTGCTLIDVSYELQFDLTCSGSTTSLSAWSPLVIGTLPVDYSVERESTEKEKVLNEALI